MTEASPGGALAGLRVIDMTLMLAGPYASMLADIEASRQLMYHVCECIDGGRRCDLEASMVKLMATEMSERVTSEGLQILGGAGYTKHHAMERHWRDARLTKIFEGTSEIQLRIISDHLLGKVKK